MYTNARRHVQRNHRPELLRRGTADHRGRNQNQQFVAVGLEHTHTREVEQPAQRIKNNALATGEPDTSSQFIVTLDNKQRLRHKRKHQERLKPSTTITIVRTNIRSDFTCGASTTVELNTHSPKSKEHSSIFSRIPDRASTCPIKRTLRTLLTVQYSNLHLLEYIPYKSDMLLKMLGKFRANIVPKNGKVSQETIYVTKGTGGSQQHIIVNLSNDILVCGWITEEHSQVLRNTFQCLREKGLTLHKGKCVYSKDSLEFFRYIFSSKGFSADPEKVDTILDLQPSTNATEVRSLHSMANHCSQFIKGYATITQPLRELTQKDTSWL